MKSTRTLLLIVFLTLFSGLSQAQKAVSDTLAYANKFETNNENYIGQHVSLLLQDMYAYIHYGKLDI